MNRQLPKRKRCQKPQPKPPHPQSDLPEAERNRLLELMIFEDEARQQGFTTIAGIDEAGRGPLAGPVVAAACVLPENTFFAGVDDSKKLTPAQREELYVTLTQNPAVTYATAVVSHLIIDEINILQATIRAMHEAIAKLLTPPDFLLVDGLQIGNMPIPHRKIPKGDTKSISIASASIIAKETRDRIMREYHQQWPEYGFDTHKGYGTERHREAIAKQGPCPIHRLTFAPLNPHKECRAITS